MKKAFNFLFITTKAGFFLLAALIWSAVMYFVNNHYQITWKEIFVEADGMVFDLIVFGVVLTIYEAYREIKEQRERVTKEKNEKIERLNEEIDDYRGWNEKEAMYRIVGAVKRLKNLGVRKIDLNGCYLKGANFHTENLNGAVLAWANLKKASFVWGDFVETNFQNAKLNGANLYVATLTNADFKWADLREANFEQANLTGAELDGAVVCHDWFEKLELWQVKGRNCIKEKYHINTQGILQLKEEFK